MGNCVNCGLPLEQDWKFCIRCGDRIASGPQPIPSAIRPAFPPADPAFPPDYEDEPSRLPRHLRLDVPLVLGVALGISGIVLIIYMLIVLSGSA